MLSNKIFAKRKEPIFQLPSKAKTQKEIEAYVDQYVKDSIAWQEREFQKWKLENITLPLHDPSKVKQRRRQVWKWSAISLIMLCFLVYSGILPISQRLQEILIFEWLPDLWFSAPPVQNLPNTPLFFSIVALLITAPIAYAIWTIRDENAAQTLENARKDTNLKDFQRLSEWASGFHLPEDKTVSLNKQATKHTDSPETTTETSTTTETYSPPKEAQQVSRRMGAESLQVAAIYQLQAFMHGTYGEQFMKPAFHMLHSIWEGLMRPLIPDMQFNADMLTDKRYREALQSIKDHRAKPLPNALNTVLFGDGGKTLRLFSDSLERLNLAGMSIEKANLSGLSFLSCDLSFCRLSDVNAQETIFDECNFSGCHIKSSNLQKSSVQSGRFMFSFIEQSKLDFLDISQSQFWGSQIQSSSLMYANFQGCQFYETQISKINLHGADFHDRVKMPDVKIQKDVKISLETKFSSSACRNEWLNAGAILVDSKTGKPIDPP